MCPEKRESGFSVVAAIFVLVVLAVLAAIIASVTGIQQASSQLDVLGVRAYHAARAGMEWGAHGVLDPNNTLNPANCDGGVGNPPNMSSCPASPTHLSLTGSLSAFTVTVTCALTADTTEGNRNVRVFSVVATACNQPPGGPCPGAPADSEYVTRELQASFSKCWDRTATAPRCECG
jgi:MSHA biogenesis protein MshP